MIYFIFLWFTVFANPDPSEEKRVFPEDAEGTRLEIATLMFDNSGGYSVSMEEKKFSEHFLSMRPFKCLEGPDKHRCHVPNPYDIVRNVSRDLVELEYDFLFLWKDADECGINL